ncbi:DUF6911 family protein [Xanthomonas pisi]|uniref:DUF6911 family protein n=1 Tax=Xanthomonas pisi TaxID=56457 RepID=UPI0011B061ED|nr:hypothetical protein [Xanthomonas pisi]
MIKLGGYILNKNGEREQLTVIQSPSLSDVENYIDALSLSSGALSVWINPKPEIGPYDLRLHAECGRFIVMLCKYMEDGDHEVDDILNTKAEKRTTEILGETYYESSVTRNIDLIKNCFSDFLKKGNISPENLVTDW